MRSKTGTPEIRLLFPTWLGFWCVFTLAHVSQYPYRCHAEEFDAIIADQHLEIELEDVASNSSRRDNSEMLSDLWWHHELQTMVIADDPTHSIQIGLTELILSALANSRKIEIAKIDRFVEQEQVTQTDANFDWNFFANSLFKNTDQQTGSELDGGAGLARLIQQQFDEDIGLKRQNYYGGNFELTQNLRLLDSNSQFVDPNEQGFSQLTLRYNQPLLRDGGLVVNYGQVILARLNAHAIAADSDTAILDIVVQVVEAYWNIYKLRSQYLVQERLVLKIRELLEEVSKRTRIDARKSLIRQAESELATQLSILAATKTQLIQAQFELVRLVGDRDLGSFVELVPLTDTPAFELPLETRNALSIALQYRPELRAAANRIKGSELTNDINIRNLLPGLAFILETNVNGVNGNFDIGRSLGDQFSTGGPTYSVGLNYEIPIGNRAARSRLREAELLVAREFANFEDTVDQIRLDVNTAVNGLTGSKDQYEIRVESYEKAESVVESLVKRRNIFPEQIDQVSQLYVREILDAQQRSANAARAVIDLLFDYSLATIQLRRAMGTLLNSRDQFCYDEYVCDPDPRSCRRFGKFKQKQAVKRGIVESSYLDREIGTSVDQIPTHATVSQLPEGVRSSFNYPEPSVRPDHRKPNSKTDNTSMPHSGENSPGRYPLPRDQQQFEYPNKSAPPGTQGYFKRGKAGRLPINRKPVARYPLPKEHFSEDEIVRIAEDRY